MRRSLFFIPLVFGSLVLNGCGGRGIEVLFDNTPAAPAPTQEAVAFATPTAAATATPTPVVIVVTATPPPVVPPTATPDKQVGRLGRSTPPPTPTPTIPGLWLFDDFESPDNDGSFDKGVWYHSPDDPTTVQQNEGFLMLSRQSPDNGELEYGPLKIEEIGFAEANLKLDSNIKAPLANASITLTNSDWSLHCSISRDQQKNEDWVDCYIPDNYGTDFVPVQANSWHTLRFEVNPDTATLSFFLDGTNIGHYNPPDPEAFKQTQVTFTLKVWAENGVLVTGYFDDVRVGKAQAGVSAVDPPLYDDFNDEKYEGTFNPEKWAAGPPQAQVGQQNGEMVFMLTQPNPGDGIALYPIQPEFWTLDEFQFMEAKLRLSSETETTRGGYGDLTLGLITPIENNRELTFGCGVTREEPIKVKCFVYIWDKTNLQAIDYSEIGFKPTKFDTDHVVRIEIDSEANGTFYIDGQLLGSYKPQQANEVKDDLFRSQIWISSETQDGIKGYADDVRIGRLE